MPTYEYRCLSCGHHIEVVQSFSDEPLRECPKCGGPLRRVFHPVGIVLKGSGFYSTDNRGSKHRPAEPKKDSGSSGESATGDTKSGDTKSGETKSGETKKESKRESTTSSSESSSSSSSSKKKSDGDSKR